MYGIQLSLNNSTMNATTGNTQFSGGSLIYWTRTTSATRSVWGVLSNNVLTIYAGRFIGLSNTEISPLSMGLTYDLPTDSLKVVWIGPGCVGTYLYTSPGKSLSLMFEKS